MGLSAGGLCNDDPDDSILGSWHANLIFIDRKKCILFVNDKTLFNFLIPDLPRELIQNISPIFVQFLTATLVEEDFPRWFIDKVLGKNEKLSFGNTNSKKILGVMNDLAFHYEFRILEAGGVHSPYVPSIISKLNRMPMGPLKYAYSVDTLRAELNSAT